MKKPPTPRPPNSQKYVKSLCPSKDLSWTGKQCHADNPEPQISAPDPKELVGTDHPASYPLDTILRDTIPTWTNYAARINLASPNSANEEGPATFATSAGIRARSQEDLRSPRQPHCQENQSPGPAGHRERFKGPPSNANMAHVPATDKRKPLHPWLELQESNSITPPQNATELHRRTPTTPAEPWESSLRCPAPPRQTPGLTSTDRH
ncbi:hypothetical protein E4T56_gene11366 [Termitomyces sp. T112]|nr:hypothetical protein E4T56_gene11366 [Termitomyces sp. T112]